jgi:hypothetical protein
LVRVEPGDVKLALSSTAGHSRHIDRRGERVARAARQADAQQALLQHAAMLVEFQRGAIGQQRHLGGAPLQATHPDDAVGWVADHVQVERRRPARGRPVIGARPGPATWMDSPFRASQSPITRSRDPNSTGISPSAVGPTFSSRLPPFDTTSANVWISSPLDL